MPARPAHSTGPALISWTLSLPPGQIFCWNRQAIIPKEAAEHGATLATSSFSLYFLAPGFRRPLQVPQGTYQHLKHMEKGCWTEQPCYVCRRGPGQPAAGERLMAPPALLLRRLTHQNTGSHVPSLGSHPLPSRYSHLAHPPSAKALVFISKPALRPYRTCCF